MRASLAKSCQCVSCRASPVTAVSDDDLLVTTCHKTFFYVTDTATKKPIIDTIFQDNQTIEQRIFDTNAGK
jgi:hypothetical protein